jgi:hypothetical protein
MKKAWIWLLGTGLVIAGLSLVNLINAQPAPEDDDDFIEEFLDETEDMPAPPKEMPKPKMGQGKMKERFEEKRKLNEEDVKKVKEFLKEFDPKLLDKLTNLEKENPRQFSAMANMALNEIRMLENLKKDNPEKYEVVLQTKKLESKTRTLNEEYRKTEDSKQKESIKKDLKSNLSQLFDLKMSLKEKEIKQMEEKIKKEREKLEKGKKDKDRLVEERLQHMTGEKEELDW